MLGLPCLTPVHYFFTSRLKYLGGKEGDSCGLLPEQKSYLEEQGYGSAHQWGAEAEGEQGAGLGPPGAKGRFLPRDFHPDSQRANLFATRLQWKLLCVCVGNAPFVIYQFFIFQI